MAKKMTLQEVFNTAVEGLASQHFYRSTVEELGCAFRGPSGRRCALGWCIPDSDYLPEMEGAVPDPNKPSSLTTWCVNNLDVKLDVLASLQMAHDASLSPSEMCLNLKAFADTHSLTIPDVLATYPVD